MAVFEISGEQESIHSAELRLNLQIALDPKLKKVVAGIVRS